MTGPIRGPGGFPLTDIVQPVLPILNIGDKQASPEQTDAESTDPAVRAAQELARRQLLETSRKEREDTARQRGDLDTMA